ncbi:MAG: TonB-dependent receptor plug domain-containing protein [Vicinamibacteraceae bacterium]
MHTHSSGFDIGVIIAAAAVLMSLVAIDARAQSIAGRISDSSGTPLADVTVVGRPTSGGHDTVTRTGPDGRYRLALPTSGAFDLLAVRSGFAEHRAPAIRVADAEVHVDLTLQTATFAEEVLVAADLGEIHTTGSRLHLTRRQTPSAVDIVTQDVIQARGPDTASTALRYVTGLTSSLRPGASAVFSSRGFIENSIGVLFSGVRVQSSTVTMRNYDAFNFDRVEVVRGPASVIHGEGLSASAINFVRRDAQPGKTRIDGLLESGDRGRVRFGVAAAGSATNRHSYAVSFARNRFETHVQDNVHEYTHPTGALRTTLPGVSVGVEGDFFVSSVEDPYWGTPLVDARIDERLVGRNYNRSSNNRYDDTVGWGRLIAGAPLAPASTYHGQVYVYRADRDWRNSYGFELVPETRRVERRSVENLAYDHRLWGTRHDVTTNVAIGGRPSRWVVGLDLSATDFSSPRSYGPPVSVDLLDPEAADFVAPPRADDRRAEVWQASAFSELRVDLEKRSGYPLRRVGHAGVRRHERVLRRATADHRHTASEPGGLPHSSPRTVH